MIACSNGRSVLRQRNRKGREPLYRSRAFLLWGHHGSRAAARAPRLKIGIIVFPDADSPLAQLDHPNLTRPNNASARGLADIVERAPVLERENALGFSPFGFANRHGDLNREQRDCTRPRPLAGKTRTPGHSCLLLRSRYQYK